MIFSYVQIGAKNPAELARFYENVLEFSPSEKTQWLCGRKGIVLEAPGFPDGNAPVFGFVNATEGRTRNINDAGYAHICFETTDVKSAVKALVKNGGSFVSVMKNPQIHPCVYCRDPEGNIVEFHIPFPSEDVSALLTAQSLLGLKKGGSLKFLHVNIITESWRALCDFSNNALGSSDFGKLKDHSGSYKEKVIGIPGVRVVGQHVLMPGLCSEHPTLEIFTYSVKGETEPVADWNIGINRIGFVSENIQNDIKAIESAGGRLLSRSSDTALLDDPQGDKILLLKK